MWNTLLRPCRRVARSRMATMPRCSRPRSSAGRSRKRPIRSWRASRSPGSGRTPTRARCWGGPEVLPVASRVLGFSTAASDLLVRHPEEVEALARRQRQEPRGARLKSSRTTRRHTATTAGLRRFRRRAMLRIAARDLDGAPFEEVVAEVSDVADACLAHACPDGYAIVALGKLGGRELNYASDVDLLLLHREEVGGDIAETDGRQPDRRPVRPDLRGRRAPRRPHAPARGAAPGSLVRTLARHPRVLRARGRHLGTPGDDQGASRRRATKGSATRSSKASPSSSTRRICTRPRSTTFGVRRFDSRSTSGVAARSSPRSSAAAAASATSSSRCSSSRSSTAAGTYVCESPTRSRALAALADEGYVAQEDAEALADAYRFLRRLEHRLQMVRDLQTHDLPADRHARTTVARSLGLAGADALQAEYDRTTELVRGIHERLFYRPLLEAFAGPVQPTPGSRSRGDRGAARRARVRAAASRVSSRCSGWWLPPRGSARSSRTCSP